MDITRRHFLKTCSMFTLGFMGLQQFACTPLFRRGPENTDLRAAGYGPLLPDSNGIIDLPAGFSYRIISRAGDFMDDGLLVPGAPDGMATFPGSDGLTLLIRNHELRPGRSGPFGRMNERLSKIAPEKIYDYGEGITPGCGGTTTLVFDTRRQEVVRQFLSLAGTVRNCAGGPTPWQSWISCEESVQRAGREKEVIYEKDHGYNFEVPATLHPHLADPIPLKAMGRFNHEAVAVDPDSGIVYQTEDRDDGLLYRFIPTVPGQLQQGGRLQALKIAGEDLRDTRNWGGDQIPVGRRFAVEWIDLEEIDSPEDDLRKRGYESGAARFARGEGMWRGSDGIYFACTNGGRAEAGQIWRYLPGAGEAKTGESTQPGMLELFIEPNDDRLIKNADNLTVSPWGDIIVCEDRSGPEVRLVGVTPQGRLYTLAHQHQESEFAGITFSPDGSTLFVNIQWKGWTLAITGPWRTSA